MTEEEALEKIKEIKGKYDGYEYEEDLEAPSSSALKSILEIAIQQPELNVIYVALNTCRYLGKLRLRRLARREADDFRASRSLLGVLDNLIKKFPDLKEEALLINDIMLNKISSMEFTNCTPVQLCDTFKSLSFITENDSKLVDKVLDVTKILSQTDNNDGNFNESLCDTLDKIIETKPELANKVWDILKNKLQDHHPDFLYHASGPLLTIAETTPDLASEIYDITSVEMQSEQISKDSLLQGYQLIANIPSKEISYKFLKQLQNDIKSDKFEDAEVLEMIYECLVCTLYQNPEHADEVFGVLETSPKMESHLIANICCNNWDELIDKNSKIADRLLTFIESYLTSKTLDNIHSPNVNNALGSIARKRSDLADKVLNMYPIRPNNKLLDFDDYYAIVPCMKHLPLEETIAKHPEMEQDLRLAHKGRFSNDEEFQYALEHFDKKTLTESMVFRAQQRVMNVLVSTSAQEDGMEKAVAESFRKPDAPQIVKDYMSNNNDWLIPASFKGAAIFKDYFPAYIKTIQNHNQKNPEDKLSIHDAVYWLPEPMNNEANERFAQFIQKNIIYQTVDASGKHKMVHRPLNELNVIAKNWKALENRLQNQGEGSDITKLKYSDVLSICMSVKYEDQRNDVFAVEAAKHGTPEAEYHNCEDIYLAGLKVPEPFDSKKEFKEGKYTGRFLPRDDPRTLFFGDYTDCCQHYGGAGHACAVSTVKHPFSQLFVIEDEQGKIIAGSWTWENTEGKYRDVCFDNIESLGELSSRPELNKIYEQVGDYLTKEQNCHKVTIGLGYQDADVSEYDSTEAVPLPKLYGNSYSDARSQVLLCENPNAEPLDKSQETQRYIRDVCFLDIEAMDKVSYAVFPDGDKQLQAPDNMAGFVIEDREKGVVGYCLYDKEEKSIYDMAVLPEYRTDKNASSKKLFAEMMRTINKEGGQWSAEMRDETTLRYLKVMAERGLVKYEEHGIDHTMSDGSQVVAVTFEPIRRDVRQATDKLKQHIEASKETSKPTQPTTTAGKIGRNPTVYE